MSATFESGVVWCVVLSCRLDVYNAGITGGAKIVYNPITDHASIKNLELGIIFDDLEVGFPSLPSPVTQVHAQLSQVQVVVIYLNTEIYTLYYICA